MPALFSAAAVFLLSLLGLIAIAIFIVIIYIAYRYDISFTIRSKDKGIKPAPEPGKHDAIP